MVRWYYSTNGKAEGPVTVEFLIEQLKAAKFTLVDLVFKEGDSAWKTFGEIPEFREAFQAPPPIVPAVPAHPAITANEIDLDEISIDDFTPTPILTQSAPAVTAAPIQRDEPVQNVGFAAPVNAAPAHAAEKTTTSTTSTAAAPVRSSFYTEPVTPYAIPESNAVKEFTKPEDGWPSDWRLSSSWIVLRKRTDGSGYDQDGPFSAEHIIEMIGNGKIEYSQYCWKPGYTRWFRIGNLPEFDRRKRDRDNDTVNQIIPVPAIAEALPALTREELLANVERLRRDKKANEKAPAEAVTKNLIETPLDHVQASPAKKPVIVAAPKEVDFDKSAIAPAPVPSPASKAYSDADSVHARPLEKAPAAAVGSAWPEASVSAQTPAAWKAAAVSKKRFSPKVMRFGLAAFVAVVVVAFLMQMANSRRREPASQPQQETPKAHKKGKVGEAEVPPVAAPVVPAAPPKVASSLEISPKNLETAAVLSFPSDMSPGDKVIVKLKGKTGEVLQVSSYQKTFEVPKTGAEDAQLDLVKEGVPQGTYFVEASVGSAQSSTQIFIGKRDDGFARELERHIKSISLRQQSEKSALFYASQRLEKLAKEILASSQALKTEPSKWKKTYSAWKAQAREATLPVITLAQSPANEMTYPDNIGAFQAATEKLAAQAKEIDAAVMQKRDLASLTGSNGASPTEDLSAEFARLREDSAKLSGRPQASN